MAWTSPKTYVADTLLTAAELNKYQRDNISFLAGLISTSTQALQANAVAGPHAIGSSVAAFIGLRVAGTFASGGGAGNSTGARIAFSLTGANGDTGGAGLSHCQIGGQGLGGSINTQGNSETVPIVSSLFLAEPVITVNGGDTVSKAATLYILNAPTEGAVNYALYVEAGITRLDGDVHVADNQRIYLDGGSDNYIQKSSGNTVRLVMSGDQVARFFRADSLGAIAVQNFGGLGSDSPVCSLAVDDSVGGTELGFSAILGLQINSFDGGELPGPIAFVGRNNDATFPAAGSLALTDNANQPWFLWVDANNDLRIHTEPPSEAHTVGDTDGTVVGDQTASWYQKKTGIEELADVAFADVAADRLRSVPLFSFRYRADGSRGDKLMHGLVIREQDRAADCWFGMNMASGQNPVLDKAEIIGTLIGGWKNLDERLEALERRAANGVTS